MIEPSEFSINWTKISAVTFWRFQRVMSNSYFIGNPHKIFQARVSLAMTPSFYFILRNRIYSIHAYRFPFSFAFFIMMNTISLLLLFFFCIFTSSFPYVNVIFSSDIQFIGIQFDWRTAVENIDMQSYNKMEWREKKKKKKMNRKEYDAIQYIKCNVALFSIRK